MAELLSAQMWLAACITIWVGGARVPSPAGPKEGGWSVDYFEVFGTQGNICTRSEGLLCRVVKVSGRADLMHAKESKCAKADAMLLHLTTCLILA